MPTIVAALPRMSGHTKEVLLLYRAFLRTVRTKLPVCVRARVTNGPAG